MEIELQPVVSLLPRQQPPGAPVEMLSGTHNSHLELQHYKILFVCDNYSRILSLLDRNTFQEVRRALLSSSS